MDFTDYDTRLGAYAVILRDDHVLLARWNEPEVPTWTLPGGGVELHESPEQAAVREVREETGYDVELGALLGVDTCVIAPERRFAPVGRRPQRNVRVFYEAVVTGGELRHAVGGSTDAARWVPLADVPALVREPMVVRYVG